MGVVPNGASGAEVEGLLGARRRARSMSRVPDGMSGVDCLSIVVFVTVRVQRNPA